MLLYSDATLTQGAWVDRKGTSMNFPLPREFQCDTFHAEFYAACRAIVDNGQKNRHIDLCCDHRGVCLMLNNHAARHPSKYPHVSSLLTILLSWTESKHMSISVRWIPSESNPADEPSRSPLMDNQSLPADINSFAELVTCLLSLYE